MQVILRVHLVTRLGAVRSGAAAWLSGRCARQVKLPITPSNLVCRVDKQAMQTVYEMTYSRTSYEFGLHSAL